MDILIKGMEMPKSCEECSFNQFHEANPWTTWETCRILDKDTDAIGEGRLADCPLVALPEHGRLIDATELEASDAILVGEEAWNMIHNAPTVLEASNGTDN